MNQNSGLSQQSHMQGTDQVHCSWRVDNTQVQCNLHTPFHISSSASATFRRRMLSLHTSAPAGTESGEQLTCSAVHAPSPLLGDPRDARCALLVPSDSLCGPCRVPRQGSYVALALTRKLASSLIGSHIHLTFTPPLPAGSKGRGDRGESWPPDLTTAREHAIATQCASAMP